MDAARTRSFGAVADEYDRARASCPDEAVRARVPAGVRSLPDMASRSRVALLAAHERAVLLDAVPEVAPSDRLALPWVCEVWRAGLG